MKQDIPDNSVHLAFADPPFNIGFKYGSYDDSKPKDEYVIWCWDWFVELYLKLTDNGTFWLAINDENVAELKMKAENVGFHLRSWVVWYYTFGVNCKNKFSRSHVHLLYFVKNPKQFTFNADDKANRIPSARQLVYGDKRASGTGRLPDDTWILRPQDFESGFNANEDVWFFPRVAGTFKEREGFHGCQMPEQLLGRIIRSCSNPGDVVFDPFSGSATTLVVAKKLGRHYIGYDVDKNYVRHGIERLNRTKLNDPLDGDPNPTQSAPKTNGCIACAGSGTSSKGTACVPCRGTGIKQPSLFPEEKDATELRRSKPHLHKTNRR